MAELLRPLLSISSAAHLLALDWRFPQWVRRKYRHPSGHRAGYRSIPWNRQDPLPIPQGGARSSYRTGGYCLLTAKAPVREVSLPLERDASLRKSGIGADTNPRLLPSDDHFLPYIAEEQGGLLFALATGEVNGLEDSTCPIASRTGLGIQFPAFDGRIHDRSPVCTWRGEQLIESPVYLCLDGSSLFRRNSLPFAVKFRLMIQNAYLSDAGFLINVSEAHGSAPALVLLTLIDTVGIETGPTIAGHLGRDSCATN